MAKSNESSEPEQVVEECAECGTGFLAVYLDDGVCDDCREATGR